VPVYGIPQRSFTGGGVEVSTPGSPALSRAKAGPGRPAPPLSPAAGASGTDGEGPVEGRIRRLLAGGSRRSSGGRSSSSSSSSGSSLPRLSWPGRHIETAFVLGGGGNRGAVQVGMLRALAERGIQPDLLVGTSVGAINASAYAGTPTLEGAYLAGDIWRRIGASDIFPRSRFHGSWRFLERREAVFSMDGLRREVTRFIRFDRIEDSPVPLVVVASRLEDCAEEWIVDGPAVDAVLASAALPGFYPVIEIGGNHYVDGGVLDNVAISAALAGGARRVFILLCGPVTAPAPPFARPYEAMFAAFTMTLGARLRRDLALVPSDVDVVVFELAGGSLFDPRDFSRSEHLIDQGYRSARSALDSYEEASGSASPPGGAPAPATAADGERKFSL
jgi:NTE family protein